MPNDKVPGFTLLEMLLSIALIAMLAGMFLPLYGAVYVKNDLDLATSAIIQDLRRAQTLSQAVDSDSMWGVHVQTGSVILFQGPNYAGRAVAFDEGFAFSNTINLAGLTDVVFSKMIGEVNPAGGGTLTLTASNNDVRAITLTTKGTLSY